MTVVTFMAFTVNILYYQTSLLVLTNLTFNTGYLFIRSSRFLFGANPSACRSVNLTPTHRLCQSFPELFKSDFMFLTLKV